MKRRPRGSERGAALFIVVLIVTLLTSIGVFAAHVTSLAQAASGYSRRAATAMYLADFVTNATATDIVSKEDKYLTRMELDEPCHVNRGVAPENAMCHVFDIDEAKNVLPPAAASDVTGPVFGVVSRDGNIQPDMYVEIHDRVNSAAVAGMGMTGSTKTTSVQVSFTAQGSLRPVTTDPETCTENLSISSARQGIRSVVRFTAIRQ